MIDDPVYLQTALREIAEEVQAGILRIEASYPGTAQELTLARRWLEHLADQLGADRPINSDPADRPQWLCVDEFEPQENGHSYSLWSSGHLFGVMDQTDCDTLTLGFSSKDEAMAYAGEVEIERIQERAMDAAEAEL